MWGRANTTYPTIASYQDAERVFNNTKPLRGRPDFRPLDKRSSMAKKQILKSGTDYIIKLYNTDILTYFEDGTILIKTGGWDTSTTTAAISCMSPFACWKDKGRTVVRMPDLKRYLISDEGLKIKDGVPLNPIPAKTCRFLVNKEKAKAVREYFKEIPKLIRVLSALLSDTPATDMKRLNLEDFITNYLVNKPLSSEEMSYLSRNFIPVVWDTKKPGFHNNKVFFDAPKEATERFWSEMYDLFGVKEMHEKELPLGEV